VPGAYATKRPSRTARNRELAELQEQQLGLRAHTRNGISERGLGEPGPLRGREPRADVRRVDGGLRGIRGSVARAHAPPACGELALGYVGCVIPLTFERFGRVVQG
jgi:hypothetical protein